MGDEIEIRERLDALLVYWRSRHAASLDAYEKASSASICALDPRLRTEVDHSAGAIEALAALASGDPVELLLAE